MNNPDAGSTAKIPLSMPKLDWAQPRDSAVMALFNATNAPGGDSTARPTIISSGSPGYDGTGDPGSPGEGV